MIKTHTCDPESNTASRVAFDPEAKALFVEFKPKLSGYRYEVGEDGEVHFDHISTVKAAHIERMASEPSATMPEFDEHGCKPGSEGSYIHRKIVGKRGGTPPYPYRPMTAEESATIFPK